MFEMFWENFVTGWGEILVATADVIDWIRS